MDWIYKVIEYVEDNLKNSMTIEDIAAVSGYSERHFQRVFRERTADSIMDYIRGRRLTLAMEEIISSQKSIIDIAFEYQFESQQNFTRAFQSRFMFPPRRFRNNELHNPPSAKKRLTEAYLGMIAREELTLEPEIIQKKEKIFIGLQSLGSLNSFADTSIIPQIGKLAADFRRRKTEIKTSAIATPLSPGSLLIVYRVPLADRANGDGLVFMAATELCSSIEVPEGMKLITVPASQYAKFHYTGALQDFSLASYYVSGCWFPRSKYWVGNGPLFNYMQIQGINSQHKQSTYYLPLRTRHDRFVDKWWQH